ncbi:MAG: hypothetical protein AB8B85_01260 [Paracoccaceae bacterium]
MLVRAVTPVYVGNMILLIWIGAGLSVLGLVGVLWCIRKALSLKGADPDQTDVKAELGTLMFVHMAAIGVAFLGMGLLVAGILLS